MEADADGFVSVEAGLDGFGEEHREPGLEQAAGRQFGATGGAEELGEGEEKKESHLSIALLQLDVEGGVFGSCGDFDVGGFPAHGDCQDAALEGLVG